MKTRELIELLAERVDVTPERAADELSRVVSTILDKLSRGSAVALPGLGVLEPGEGRNVRLRPALANGRKKGRARK